MNLYIVRHGNPDYSRDVLTELGHKQAEACAEDMLSLGIDEIYASSYGRAQETAAHLANKLGLPVNVEPWAHEVEYYCDNGHGHVTHGVSMDPAILRSPEMEALGDRWYDHPAFTEKEKAIEMVQTLREGAEDFMLRLGYKLEGHRFKIIEPSEKNVALYCHAGSFLLLAGFLLQLPELTAWHSFFMYQTGIAWVNLNNSDLGYTVPRFYYINKTDHLTKRGLPLT